MASVGSNALDCSAMVLVHLNSSLECSAMVLAHLNCSAMVLAQEVGKVPTENKTALQ